MHEVDIHRLRAAGAIRQWIAARRRASGRICLPDRAWERMQRLLRRCERARQQGWKWAARRLEVDLLREIQCCHKQLQHVVSALQEQLQRPPLPSLDALYQEIRDLSKEFAEVSCDLLAGELAVVSEPIVLEGIHLGRFRICLDFKQQQSSAGYWIEAIDPHPPLSNSSVTHPHVQHEQLCEGAGATAIEAALAEGRLGDFFLLVTTILRTYSPEQAFVKLHVWEGIVCTDCGTTAAADRRHYCHGCTHVLCDECGVLCATCEAGYCSRCIAICGRCRQYGCRQCLAVCQECSGQVCTGCLVGGRCTTCLPPTLDGDPHATGLQRLPEARSSDVASLDRDAF